MTLLIAFSARADLLGTSVTGQLTIANGVTNYFESANHEVPAGYGNSGLGTSTTVTIGSGIEFGYNDGVNFDTVDFTGTMVTLQDVSQRNSGIIHYSFTDTAFTGLTLSQDSENFPNGVTATLVGDVLTISSAGFNSSGTFSAVYTLSSAGVPEPSGWLLLATLILALALVARKRIAQAL